MAHDLNPVDPIDGSSTPRRSGGLVSLELDGEVLLLDPRTDGLHHLDRLGTIIWKVLDGEATVDELVDDLADAFATPVDTVRTDLSSLLTTLAAVGLLDGSQPPAHLVVGTKAAAEAGTEAGATADGEGVWRPEYLVDPPAP